MIAVKPGETFIIEQEVWFDGHRLGSNTPIPSGQIKIRRNTDGFFWDGAAFVIPEAYLATTISVDGLYHSYSFAFPATEDVAYTINIRVNNDTDTERVGNFITRSAAPVFDSTDFATGFPFR